MKKFLLGFVLGSALTIMGIALMDEFDRAAEALSPEDDGWR